MYVGHLFGLDPLFKAFSLTFCSWPDKVVE